MFSKSLQCCSRVHFVACTTRPLLCSECARKSQQPHQNGLVKPYSRPKPDQRGSGERAHPGRKSAASSSCASPAEGAFLGVASIKSIRGPGWSYTSHKYHRAQLNLMRLWTLQVDRKFFIRPDMHETDAYQVRLVLHSAESISACYLQCL